MDSGSVWGFGGLEVGIQGLGASLDSGSFVDLWLKVQAWGLGFRIQ